MGKYFLDPNADLIRQHSIVGPYTTAWDLLERNDRDGSSPGTDVYLVGDTTTVTELTRVETEVIYKASVISVDSVYLVFYSQGQAATNQLTARILVGSDIKAESSYTGVYAATWNTIVWASGDITQQDIHDLRIEFETYEPVPAVADKPKIFAAYLQLNTTDTPLVFTPVADNYTGAPVKKWRPRIKPGAFYI